MNNQLDYEYKASTSEFVTLQDREHFISSLSILLEWSPFSTEAELLQQASLLLKDFSMQPMFTICMITGDLVKTLRFMSRIFHYCDAIH